MKKRRNAVAKDEPPRAAAPLAGAVPADLPNVALLRLDQVLLYVPVSRSVWFEGMRAGHFPAGARYGKTRFWTAREIRRVIETFGQIARAHEDELRRARNRPPAPDRPQHTDA